MFVRLFLVAILAGLSAGLAMAAVQQWRIAPLILAAEEFEAASFVHQHEDGSTHDHSPAAAEWQPAPGFERIGLTVLADLLLGVGFALVMVAASALTGIPATPANGLVWGLAGFLAFQLAPAFGLPPELPGIPTADLAARQVWWWGTAAATAAGLLAIALWRTPLAWLAALVLILAPHLIGAPPAPQDAVASVPARLAADYVASVLVAGAVFWLLLGPIVGHLVARFENGTQ